MGFASGFRTGLATGGERRSMMPIVQGLGSMIDRIEKRNKKGSVRFGGSMGPSSYDKYVARKDKEEAQAEEKRRYDEQQQKAGERQEMETEQAAAQAERQAVQDEQAAQMHEEKVKSIQDEREKAGKLFERSEKKEKRVEAYRGFIQGIQSRNKALTEASWAALAPDMPKGQEADWAEIETEEYINPATGKPEMDKEGNPIKKYVVGRGKGDKKGMPAPSFEFNEDGSIQVQYPGTDEPEVYPDSKTFAENVGYHLNPEFETGGKGDKDKKKERKENVKNELKFVDQDIKELDTQYKNDAISQEDYDEKIGPLKEERDRLRLAVTGKGGKKKQKTAVAEAEPAAGEGEVAAAETPQYKMDTKSGIEGYAGEAKPPDKGAKRRADGIWFRPDPENPGKWQIITEAPAASPKAIALEQGD